MTFSPESRCHVILSRIVKIDVKTSLTKSVFFFNVAFASLSLNIAFVTNDPHATNTAGWRLIIFPCGMPACVTPRKHPTPRRGALQYYVPIGRFLHIGIFCSSARGSFLVLSVAGHAGGRREHCGTSVALAEVCGTCSGGSKSRKLANSHGTRFRPPRASQVPCKPVRWFLHPHEL